MQQTRSKMWCFKLAEVRGKVLAILCFILFAICLGTKAEHEHEVAERRNHFFANRLYQAISEENSKDKLSNLIFSPLSLEIVLAVAGLGAKGNTKTQISNGIGVPLELSILRSKYSPILFGIKEDERCILRIASQIFVEQRFPLNQDFVNASAVGFACGTQLIDFATHPDLAVVTMNAWVEEKTQGLIKGLFDSSTITSNTQVVLINAIYFKGKWVMPFNSTLTTKKKFQLAEGNKVDVDMMNGEVWSHYGHPKDLNAKVLELPYVGEQLSMVFLLPDKTSSIAELESKISAETFNLHEIITNHTRTSDVYVSLPKFRLEMKTDLESSLSKLGMSDMFTNHADFSGMSTSSNGLKVSKVIQKAFIEVSEEGTEAAAATDMEVIPLMGRTRPNFRANRPFVFILFHKVSRTNLFIGRLADPTHFP